MIQDETRKWLDLHYPDIFSDLHFGNHYATPGNPSSRAPTRCMITFSSLDLVPDATSTLMSEARACPRVWAESGRARSKGEMCEAIGARLLVDDSLKYALQVATESRIEVLLFGESLMSKRSPGGERGAT